MDTLLITGVAGFIGSTFAEKIIDNYRLVGIDDFNDYYSPTIKEKNIAALLKNKNLTLYRGDIRDEKLLVKIFTKHKIDKVIHLAARAGVRPSLEYPQLYISVNFIGTQLLLEKATKAGIKQFVFASSSSVYGNSAKVPFTESDHIDQPISPYAISKICGEKLCRLYHDVYKVPMTILRFFSVYGPRGRPDMAPYIFTKKIIKGEEIPVFGNGSQSRDFTYIDDIVHGLNQAITKPYDFEIINLGNSYPTSVNELITTIEKLTGINAKIKYLSPRLGDVERTFANIAKAKIKLKWQPQTKIEEGMKNFIAWYKKTYNA